MGYSTHPLRLPRWLLAWGSFYWPPRREGIFYLTIDDGPEPEALAKILPLLQQYKAQATFFWLGQKVEKYQDSIDLSFLYRQGHGLGLHGYRHSDPWRLSRAAWIADVEKGFRVLSRGLPHPPSYYRPPYGRYRPMRGRWPLRVVLWDLMPPDYRVATGWADPALQALKAGDLVVLHERKGLCLSEWEKFLIGARQRGLQATSLPNRFLFRSRP